jgi:GNAT superfamily N-acetyltransferase
VIRPADLDADAPAAVRLLAAVRPEWVFSAESLRHRLASSPPEARLAAWCVEEGDELIGWAIASLMVETSEAGVGWIGVNVHPKRRRAGLGSALLSAAERHAHEIGVARLLSFARGDDGSASFARSHGYEQTASNEILVVDPRAVEPPVVPAGVGLRPFSAFADDPSPIFHVDTTSMLDEPGDARFDSITYDYWRERFLGNPLLDHEASTVALVEGTVAAYTMLLIDRTTGRGQNNGTGTLPEFRGRGLATLAKRACLARAAELGCTAVYTGNNEANAPMLAINRKLGYVPCTRELSLVKRVEADTGR